MSFKDTSICAHFFERREVPRFPGSPFFGGPSILMQLRFELKQRDQLKKVLRSRGGSTGKAGLQAFKIGDGIHSKLKEICFLSASRKV